MRKFSSKLAALFVLGLLVFPLPASAATTLTVVFEATPLFSEANFMPGDSVTRWVQVTNISGGAVNMGAKLDPFSDPDGLGSQLDTIIKEGATVLYTGTLASLYAAGEVLLSALADTATTQYDISVTFNPTAGDPYQGKSVGFDFIIGSLGTATPTPTPLGSGGGGGGGGGGVGEPLDPSPSPSLSPSPSPEIAGEETTAPKPPKSFIPQISGIAFNAGGTPSPSGEPSPSAIDQPAIIAGALDGSAFCGSTASWLFWLTLAILLFGAVFYLWPSTGISSRNSRILRWLVPLGIIYVLWARSCLWAFWWIPIVVIVIVYGVLRAAGIASQNQGSNSA